MTEKRFEMVIVDVQGNFYYLDKVTDEKISSTLALEGKLNELAEENEKLKKDVEYWKQVASHYSNELNIFEHIKQHKTECKDIHWSSD